MGSLRSHINSFSNFLIVWSVWMTGCCTCHGCRRLHEEVDASCSLAVTKQGHPLRVAPKALDVLLDPFESRDLIKIKVKCFVLSGIK